MRQLGVAALGHDNIFLHRLFRKAVFREHELKRFDPELDSSFFHHSYLIFLGLLEAIGMSELECHCSLVCLPANFLNNSGSFISFGGIMLRLCGVGT